IQLLRKDPEEIARRLATRGAGVFDRERFERLESERKQLQTRVEQAQASRNRLAKEIGGAKAKGQDASALLAEAERSKAELEAAEQQLAKLQAEVLDFLERIPNIPHESVPLGESAEHNREERRCG